MRGTTMTYDHSAFDAGVIAAWRAGKDTYTIAQERGVSESAVHRIITAEREARLALSCEAA